MALQNAALQVGTMSWSDLYPGATNLNPATTAPQTGPQASGGAGVSGGGGVNASHWLIGGIVTIVVFRFIWERETLGKG